MDDEGKERCRRRRATQQKQKNENDKDNAPDRQQIVAAFTELYALCMQHWVSCMQAGGGGQG